MRGAGDELTTGKRIAFYRSRRGLTQTQLANLVGRGPDWLGKIERDERRLRNVETLVELSRALRVQLGDLIGQSVLLEDAEDLDDVPAIRDALMAPERLSAVLYDRSAATDIDVTRSALLVEYGWTDYQRGRVGEVVARLPSLIRAAQHAEDTAREPSTPHRRQLYELSARAHHLAATTLSKIGEADLSWIAAERAMRAADRSEDPLVLASTARAATHALLAVGRFDDAVDVGTTAVRWLARHVAQADPVALSLFGMLHLRMAVAAARRQNRVAAMESLDRATAAAERLGENTDYRHTSFGPANVAVHRISVGLDLGDVVWVADKGPGVDTAELPVERRVTHLIDVARAMAQLARDESALMLLLNAEAQAPTLVRQSPAVRDAVQAMYRRTRVTGGTRSSDLLALARRCRAVR